MKPGLSIWLDALRAGACLAVLLGHFAHTRFTRGDYAVLRDINLAADAVVVFFVISGVVISYAAGRDGALGRFAFNRLTRLLTVVAPALVLTLVFDRIGVAARPEAYPALYYNEVSPATALLRGLTFSNEWNGVMDRLRLGSNGPLWSLSYEAAYYILFGIAVFLSGPMRLAALAAIAFVVGWPILFLMPAWLAGVFVWRALAAPLSDRTAWLLAVGFPLVLVALKLSGVDHTLTNITAAAFAPASHHAVLLYADEALWSGVIALMIALHLIGAAHLLGRVKVNERAWPIRAIRYAAGASFSLYVIHYPTMHLLDALLPENVPFYDAVFFGMVLALGFAFAAAFERPIRFYRGLFRASVRA